MDLPYIDFASTTHFKNQIENHYCIKNLTSIVSTPIYIKISYYILETEVAIVLYNGRGLATGFCIAPPDQLLITLQ